MIQHDVREALIARFLRYVQIDTQSSYESASYPSTSKQYDLLSLLRSELEEMGASEVTMDQYGYVMAMIPASPGCESVPTVGLIAHVDTSPDLSGAGVRPQLIPNYDGGDIALGDSGYVLSPRDFPELKHVVGHDLITTDGTTLLGADDKAGVAEVMTIAHYLLMHPELEHGPVRIAFTADEEIGRGVDYFDVEAFGANYAYTLDGGSEGELEYECFNACSATIVVQGRNVHPGYAKGKMINALQVLHDIHAALPAEERPEYTEGYEGFYHLTNVSGSVDQAEAHYIIRDHDRATFEERKAILREIVAYLNDSLGGSFIQMKLEDHYYNMKDKVIAHPELIKLAEEAMTLSGVVPNIRPIRGGTDGARLSYMGLPCPNIFAGGMNFHSRYEYASQQTMSRTVEVMIRTLGLFVRDYR